MQGTQRLGIFGLSTGPKGVEVPVRKASPNMEPQEEHVVTLGSRYKGLERSETYKPLKPLLWRRPGMAGLAAWGVLEAREGARQPQSAEPYPQPKPQQIQQRSRSGCLVGHPRPEQKPRPLRNPQVKPQNQLSVSG